MTIFLNFLFLIIGIILLIKGADFFVDSSSSIARKLKIPGIIIGLTIVSFGTSAPELAVSVSASIQANLAGTTADIAMGNVVGSNLFNILVVLGVSSILTPTIVSKNILRKEFPFLIMTTIILALFSLDTVLGNGNKNVIVRGEGLTLMLMLVLFLYILVSTTLKEQRELTFEEEIDKIIVHSDENIKTMKTSISILFLIIGLAGIIIGAEFVTTPAKFLATKFATSIGVDPSMATTLVGLTVVALGTSLPELVTSIVAAKKGENDIALGNVIGSNIFNTVLIVGAAGSICNLGINNAVVIDIVIMLAITSIVFVIAITKNNISKKEGFFLLGIYFVYLVYIILRVVI